MQEPTRGVPLPGAEFAIAARGTRWSTAGPLVVEVAVADELADDGRARDDVDVHHGQEVVEEADETARLRVFGHRVVDLQQQLHGVVLEKGQLVHERRVECCF
jgi:hypothetical protein